MYISFIVYTGKSMWKLPSDPVHLLIPKDNQKKPLCMIYKSNPSSLQRSTASFAIGIHLGITYEYSPLIWSTSTTYHLDPMMSCSHFNQLSYTHSLHVLRYLFLNITIIFHARLFSSVGRAWSVQYISMFEFHTLMLSFKVLICKILHETLRSRVWVTCAP